MTSEFSTQRTNQKERDIGCTSEKKFFDGSEQNTPSVAQSRTKERKSCNQIIDISQKNQEGQIAMAKSPADQTQS